ncbi:MAG TPA: flagellar hook-length control protein FliK, partial [Pilimelia sp.]|nr:flagellar hook-length control protein FliK [Pilimelia sp.]
TTTPAATTTGPTPTTTGIDTAEGIPAGPASTPEPARVEAYPAAAAAPVAAQAPVAQPAAASPATGTPPATAFTAPAQQVAMHLGPLRLDGDGIHRLTVHLHPADLGPVSVVAEIRDGAISVQLAGATDAGREALRGSLPDLRRELQDAGYANCSLDVRADSDQRGQQFRPPSGGQADPGARGDRRTPPPVDPRTPADPARPATDRRLDLHV